MKKLLSIIVIVGYVISLTGCITGSGVIKENNETVLHAEAGEDSWTEKGYGSSEKDAVFEAKWSVIEKALEEVIGDEAMEKGYLIKEKFKKERNSSKFLRDFKKISVRKEDGEYVVRVNAIVNMATLRNEAKKIIKKAGGGNLPSIAIKEPSEKEHEGLGKGLGDELRSRFSSNGYNAFVFEVKDSNIKMGAERDVSEAVERKKVHTAGAQYIAKFTSIKYNSTGKDKITGNSCHKLYINVQIITGEGKILAEKGATVENCSAREDLFKDAVEKIFDEINSQIIADWGVQKGLYTAYVSNDIGNKKYWAIFDVLIKLTGDDNPREESDIGWRKLHFTLSSGKIINSRKIGEEIGKEISDDFSIECDDNTARITIGR